MLARLRIFTLLLFALFAMQAVAGNDVAVSLYERWEHLPSGQLMQMGEQYRNVTRQPDSALVCFSIVANRYYQGHRSHDDIEHAIEANTHIAILYMNDFYDYPKAVSYNLRAKELANKQQCFDYMPFILINDANIEGIIHSFENDSQFSTRIVCLYQEAFNLAYQQKNWYALNVAFMNLMLHTTFHGRARLIEREMDIVKNTQIPDSTTHFKYARCLIDAVRASNNGQLDSAGMYFNRLLDIAQEHKNLRQKTLSLIVANDYLSNYYGATGQDDKNIAVLKENERIAMEANEKVHLIDAYNNQMRYYQYIGNQQMADRYHLLFLEGKVSLLTDKKLGSANEAKFLYEIDKKNEQVCEIAVREQMKNRMLWGALAFAIVLIVMLVLLWLNYRRVQENNRQLYEKSLEMLRADEEKRQLIEQLQRVPVEENPEEEASPYAPTEEPRREGKLSPARQSELLHRVFMVMETSDEIYSPNFTLTRLAELVGDTRNNVSEAINRRYKDNFNGLINEYRIKEACRRINDRTQWSDYTLEAIGQSVGFKSRSTFWTTFKEIVGLTPGAYQRQSS